MNDFDRLKEHIGRGFDYEELMCCLTDKDVHVEFSDADDYSNFEGFGRCSLYQLYYDLEDADIYNIWVDRRNVIAAIDIC